MNPCEDKSALSKKEESEGAYERPNQSQESSRFGSYLRGGIGKTRGFATVNGVLNDVVANLGLDKRLKEHALLNLWPQFVGDEMAGKSRPLFIDREGNLVIAVKDAPTGQELSLTKPGILRKLKLAGQGIGLAIKGLRFDLKHFYSLSHGPPEPSSLDDPFRALLKTQPTKEELEAVSLSEEDTRELVELEKNLANFQTVENPKVRATASRVFRLFEHELKLRQWRKLNGFPACSVCQLPTPYFYGKDALCSNCYCQSYIR